MEANRYNLRSTWREEAHIPVQVPVNGSLRSTTELVNSKLTQSWQAPVQTLVGLRY